MQFTFIVEYVRHHLRGERLKPAEFHLMAHNLINNMDDPYF